MTPEEFQRLRRLFEESLELPSEDRPAFLDRACGDDIALRRQLEAMSLANEPSTFLEPPAETEDVAFESPPPLPEIPRQVGAFRIERMIGSGGMGLVFEAAQENPRRRVALKMMRFEDRSTAGRRRFEFETEVLAQLDHPAIARIFEAGILEDGTRPYFAMEYVSGARDILTYCREKQSGRADRLRLFAEVCEAIEHGHRRGVLHRDIKAGNVLVDEEGHPKVIDFGVARSLSPDSASHPTLTGEGDLVGTLHTMAPEQLEGAGGRSVDTRTDVYALGYLLYQLLFDRPPYDFTGHSLSEVAAIIRESPPIAPSRSTDVPRELGWIALRALEKDPRRRYASVGELIADLQRFERREPVSAAAPSKVYRLRKLVQRHRLAFGAAFLIALSLIVGGAATITALVRANIENEKYREANEILVDMLQGARAELGGGYDVPASVLVDRVVERLDRRPPRLAEVEAPLRRTLAQTYLSLGLPARAEDQARRALELYEDHSSLPESERLLSAYALGVSLLQQDHRDELGELIERFARGEANDARLGIGGVELLQLEAMWLGAEGRYAEAEAVFRRALTQYARVYGPEHEETGVASASLSRLLVKRGKLQEAEEIARSNLDALVRRHGSDSAAAAHARQHLVWILSLIEKRRPETIEILEEVLPDLERIHGPDHPRVALARVSLADLWKVQGDPAKALPLLRSALEQHRRIFGSEHSNTLTVIQSLAETLLILEDPAAEPALVEALELRERILGPTHPSTLHARLLLGRFYRRAERWPEAREVLGPLFDETAEALGPNSEAAIQALAEQSMLCLEAGEPRAIEAMEKALKEAREHLDPTHSLIPRLANNLIVLLMKEARLVDALHVAEESLESMKANSSPSQPGLYTYFANVIEIHILLGQTDRALELATEGAELADRSLPQAHPSRARIFLRLADCSHRSGEVETTLHAIDELEKVEDLTQAFSPSERFQIRLIHGLNLKRSGREEEALREYERCLAIEVDHPQRPDVQREAKALRERLAGSGR